MRRKKENTAKKFNKISIGLGLPGIYIICFERRGIKT